MHGFVRFFIGAIGGLAASASKVMALDTDLLALALERGLVDEASSLKVTIFIFTPILMTIGGIVAWVTDESNRTKLLAIGCAAPAIIAPWTANPQMLSTPTQTSFLFPSFVGAAKANSHNIIETTSESRFIKGVKVLFGVESIADNRYWVIVGSSKNYVSACNQVNQINSKNINAKAFIGSREIGNPYYPIIVGGPTAYYPFKKAALLKKEMTTFEYIPHNIYLSNNKSRLSQPIAKPPNGIPICQ